MSSPQSLRFTICPDFKPDRISGWYICNTWLQKKLNASIHLEMTQTFDEQNSAIAAQQVDIIYANPYDVSRLVRDEGFIPVVKPAAKPDEAIVAVRADSPIQSFSQLPGTVTIAQTDARDVNTISMIMLEPADLKQEAITLDLCDSYVGVAKRLLKGDADLGFFLAERYNELSALVKKQLRVLIRSQIHLIHHALLISPKIAHREEELRSIFTGMHEDAKSQAILNDLEISQWLPMDHEDAEFMIDLIETLEPE